MKKSFLLFSVLVITKFRVDAQTNWPQVLKTSMGAVVKLYEPQPDSLAGNNLWYHAAFSYLESGKAAPQFGSYQADAQVDIDRDNRTIRFDTVTILQLDLRGVDPALSRKLGPFIGAGITGLGAEVSLDVVLSSLDMATAERNLSKNLETRPPRVIYADRPSILVTIDGEPYIQQNREFRMDAVVNSPFIILKHQNTWYLYGGRHWYTAIAPTGPYSYVPAIPRDMAGVQAAMDLADSALGAHSDTAREGADIVAGIIVTTVPAELIQTTGEPGFAPIGGTGLLYVTNSANDIFLDTGSQSYFVLLSGRWYRAPALQGIWDYVPADSLPSDFARIPEGSPKDNVLASVAGTPAAREAIVDAQIPQTAEIDRKTATVQVVYDGDPRFAAIRGTGMQYAVNTGSTVILYRNRYFCAENGAWYMAVGPHGPWT